MALDSRGLKYNHGIIHTTNYRLWEFDEGFREELLAERARAIDMECATLFAVAFSLRLKVGALLLISDLPLAVEGIKTKRGSEEVFENYAGPHLEIGRQSLRQIMAEEEQES